MGGDFNIFDNKKLSKCGFVVAGNFSTAASKGGFKLVAYEASEKVRPKHDIYMIDNPSFGLNDVLSYTNPSLRLV